MTPAKGRIYTLRVAIPIDIGGRVLLSGRAARGINRERARVAQWQRNRFVIGRLAGSNPLSGSSRNTRSFARSERTLQGWESG